MVGRFGNLRYCAVRRNFWIRWLFIEGYNARPGFPFSSVTMRRLPDQDGILGRAMIMKKFLGVLLVVAGCLVWDRTAQAQETNVPPTRIEAFEVQTGVILLKAVGHVGEISAKGAIISVRYKETTDARTGRKEHGMVIAVKEGDQPEDVTFIDYD